MFHLWKSKLRVVAAILLAGAALSLENAPAQDRTDNKNADDQDAWMQSKLAGSQQILADLTHADLESVAADARRLQVMNYLEKWLASSELSEVSEYRGQLNAFEYSTKELIRHADDGNVDGALDAYLAMTRTCVECHKLLRDAAE